MTIWWLILISSAIFLAWLLGFLARHNRAATEHVNLPRDYLVGLNFLLNEEPDKAVDIFIKMLEVDSDTVETHLAVGKLFRRRGEVDRAIRIHQNLIARPQLDKAYREQSLFELGQDYYSAGMFDRAERVFLDLVEVKQYSAQALHALIDIYQHERSWNDAIKMATKYESVTRKNMQPVIAHYYCELAELACQARDHIQAASYAKQALHADPSCVRASLFLAKSDISQKDFKSALKYLKKIKHQNPDYLSEAIVHFAVCYEALENEEKLVSYLMDILEEHPHVPVVLILSERIQRKKGDKVALTYVADYVRRYPSLQGLYLLVNLYMSGVEGRARDDLIILQNLMKKLLADKPDYQCVSCGFSGRSLHWLCPGCRQWSSVKPIHCLES